MIHHDAIKYVLMIYGIKINKTMLNNFYRKYTATPTFGYKLARRAGVKDGGNHRAEM